MTCRLHSKRCYKTELDAMLALSSCKRKLKLKSDFSRKESRIYFDKACGFWHLTSMKATTAARRDSGINAGIIGHKKGTDK